MTELEADLYITKCELDLANKRISELEQQLVAPSRCTFGAGIVIKPDGINELDPCLYDLIEKHEGVTVEILRCKRCGHQEIMWYYEGDDH